MDDVVAECGAVCTCLVSCFAGLDVVLAAVPAAGATLPTVLAADVAFNGVVDGGADRMTAGGGGMELESEDDDTSAFTATEGISLVKTMMNFPMVQLLSCHHLLYEEQQQIPLSILHLRF